jgi:type IV secretion system protein VirB6
MQTTIDLANQIFSADFGLQHIKDMMSGVLGGSNLLFFKLINDFLDREIAEFGVNLLGRTMAWVGSVALTLMTIWIMIQGYRIVTGQSRDSMMALVVNSLRATFIVGVATAWGATGPNIFNWLTDGVQSNINEVVTGSTTSAYENIDRSLGFMQLAFSSIDAVQDGNSEKVDEAKTRAMWFSGIGTGGPAITAGVMLLLNKIAMALFTGLGPIFILCLLFDQTKQLFSKWLYYGIGTMFSLAVLSVMVALALDVVLAVSASFWVGKFLGGSSEGVNSMAMQQGGLGLILTMLIISAPPIAASFFQGVLANFNPYSAFNTSAGYSTGPALNNQQQASQYPPGHPAYRASPAPQSTTTTTSNASGAPPNSGTQPYLGAGQTSTVTNNEIRTAQDARLANAQPGTNVNTPTTAGGANNTVIPPVNLPPKPPGGTG